MSSITPNRAATEDLSTPARIRDAAIQCFADAGFQKTSIRVIASAAGVSPGLVIHHFGSKDKLREVCDEYILSKTFERASNESSPQGFQQVLQQHLENPREFDLEIRYLSRAVTDDSPMGQKFVSLVIDETESIVRAGISDGSMNPSSDPRALAVFITMTSLAMLTMSKYVSQALDTEEFDQAFTQRMALPALELFTHGLYSDDAYLRAAQEVLSDSSPTSEEEPQQRQQRQRKEGERL
ncbi:AcrR family transcriptional regulator [Psychromicrobium silvestre]|uniref:AcrR family transcriptional regulator n=1 Tax=Psychromicrobium silvestre TaxID=1645614 RepID=A0A7Y9S7W4_9MICC|nr:TetR family transcriptional regulator [Psychromicrobium silvestre]NYE95406.1 AcrR family transcriptional regulator [Psychromicrobium silvestre]